MRVVLIGVSHWHAPFFLDPCLAMPNVAVVGVAPHSEMAELARFLIAQRIPFAIEKPCAVNAAEAVDIAARASEAKMFAAVPYVLIAPLVETILSTNEPVQHAMFEFIGGMVDRYRQQRVEWVIDRKTSGGGALLNLGVRFMDLCSVLLQGRELTVTGSMMANHHAHPNIEDHAVMLMRGGEASCMVEIGYLYPAANSVFDGHYSIRTERHYFSARNDRTLEIVSDDRQRTTRLMKPTNVYFYLTFVWDTLQRLEEGRKPVADLMDNAAAAVGLVQAAYTMSPLGF